MKHRKGLQTRNTGYGKAFVLSQKKVCMGEIQENWVTHPNAWHPHLTSHLQLKTEEGAEHGECQFWETPRGILPSPLRRMSPLPATGRETSLQMELPLLNASVSYKSDPTSFSEFSPHILFLRKKQLITMTAPKRHIFRWQDQLLETVQLTSLFVQKDV